MSLSNTNPAGNPRINPITRPTTVGVQVGEVANHRSDGFERFELVTIRLQEGESR